MKCTKYTKIEANSQNVVRKIISLGKTKQYVYDLETENHHFSAGIGKLIVHNTDCVHATTPVLISNDSMIDYKTVEELSNGNWTRINPNKEISQAKRGYKIWSDKGFTDIVNVVRCGIKKPLSRILTHVGEVTCSTEHSLLRENLECVSPMDLKVNDKLCIAELPLPEDTPKHPLYNKLTSEDIYNYEIPDVIYGDINAELAFAWGMFYAHGSCGMYECTLSWVINNQDNKLLDRCLNILRNELSIISIISMNFKILDTQLVATHQIEHRYELRRFIERYRELFYDHREYKKVPTIILNSPFAIRQSFFMGYYAGNGRKDPDISLSNKGSIGSASLFYILKSIGYQVSIDTISDDEIYKLTGSTRDKKMRAIPNAVTNIVDITGEEGEYIYDIQTGNHHFAAGVGELVVHNSTYVSFPHIISPSELWDYAIYVANEISNMFPAPLKIEFEEAIYEKYLILTKKRYMYNTSDRNGNVSNKIGKKGVLLARRDNSPCIRNLYEAVISKIFNGSTKEQISMFIINELNNICGNGLPHKDFVITKSVGDVSMLHNMSLDGKIRDGEGGCVDYSFKNEKGVQKAKIGDYTTPLIMVDEKDKQLIKKHVNNEKEFYLKSLPGQVQLAERMRDRGMRIDPGSRLEYVIIESEDNLKDKTSEKMESADYYARHKDILKIDFTYYLKLLANPLDQVFKVAFKQNDFILKQYKYRIQKMKVQDELKELFNPKIVFVIK